MCTDRQLNENIKILISNPELCKQMGSKCREFVEKNKSQDIIFTVFATGELKRQLLSHSGLFVQPSTIEGMPISVLEAMGYGIPVIASNIREIRDIVIDKELLFEAGDSESLNKILSVVLKNVEVHKQFALEKRGEILAKYNWDSTAKELDGLLCKLI
jgi:glycosyltransferase involved in cell wall biosynthesis